ncbi:MAG: diphthine--ammonia ligase [Candidatus Scalindua sp. AMX11]|nr:MAG: diphthine--ammonia ligase [Candidatus Scalindua sp.]NOG84484.1 diphthine--ammonia ligase [Planctomycetota bacterium]RZV80507.1 MAG: diphthine--ammonia ligase [Candidatus Scalindua sp. SCAELEC01]TDE65315.1 MAG: diphthine--ammonia ligase [Candidatus Scalindua sp. AMX11]
MNNQRFTFACSFSGGKDSCLALYRAIHAGGDAKKLITMFTEGGERSRSHGLHLSVVTAQSQAMNIPLLTRTTLWNDYEKQFKAALTSVKREGIQRVVFGDIDLQEHRDWEERVCEGIGLRPFLPLWLEGRKALLGEFLDLGFCAMIIALKEDVLPTTLLGKTLSRSVIEVIERQGVDACGEEGEYHTLVYDGPIFQSPLALTLGEKTLRDGYWFLDLHLK